MSLDFSWKNIKDGDTVTTHPEDLDKTSGQRYHPVFDKLVWSMMVIGVTKITEANLQMVQDRMAMYQKALGPAMVSSVGEIYITDEDVARYVGLSTNVSQMTDKQWLEHLGEMILREATFRAPTHYSPNTSAYDMTAYLTIRKDDGTYYVQ